MPNHNHNAKHKHETLAYLVLDTTEHGVEIGGGPRPLGRIVVVVPSSVSIANVEVVRRIGDVGTSVDGNRTFPELAAAFPPAVAAGAAGAAEAEETEVEATAEEGAPEEAETPAEVEAPMEAGAPTEEALAGFGGGATTAAQGSG